MILTVGFWFFRDERKWITQFLEIRLDFLPV